MTQSISNLTWAASGDPKVPFANVTVNFATDKNWIIGLIGEYLSLEQRPRGVTVDNTANNQNVVVTIGPVTFTVNQFARQTLAIPNGQAALTIAGTIGTVGLIFFVSSLAPTADGANQYAISQAAATTAAQLNSSAMNPIINSQFTVWPEGTATSNVSAAAFYGTEGWQGRRSGGVTNVLFSQAAGIINSRYSLQVQRPATDNTATLIEVWTQLQTVDCLSFQGQTITLGYDIVFGADFDLAGLGVQVIAGVGADQNLIVGGFTGAAVIGTDTVTKNTAGARRTLTVTVPVNATQLGIYIPWNNPAAAAGANDWFRISRFQFDIGTTAQAYRPVPDAIEVARCQYYFERVDISSYCQFFASGFMIGPNTIQAQFKFVPKRTAPSITISAASDFGMYAVSGGGVVPTPFTSMSVGQLGLSGCLVTGNDAAPNYTIGQGAMVYQASGSGSIKISARL